jgi:arylformamidase
MMKPIDVTLELSPATAIWPGAPRFSIELKQMEIGGSIATSSFFSMTPHCGTHIDAPLHFAHGGQTIDAVSLDWLIGPCQVLEHLGSGHISKDDLAAMGFVPRERVLIKTRNSLKPRTSDFDFDFISLLPDAIEHMVASGVRVLGVDGFSIGPFGDLTTHNHRIFCGAGGIIIELLDLSTVEAGEYFMIALPLRIKGAEGSPARVVLFPPENGSEALIAHNNPTA